MPQEKDLTQGNLISTLLLFAFPYIIANFLQVTVQPWSSPCMNHARMNEDMAQTMS